MYVNEYIKNTQRVFPMQGRYEYLRYDMNENPEGLPEHFVQSVLKEITPEFLATYPEPEDFQKSFAEYLNVNYNQVLATNGSDMAIRYIFETFGETKKEVVTVSPSFAMYEVNCNILGFCNIHVSYNEDLSINVEKIIDSINANTRIVVLLNPNNPIGNVYTEKEIDSIIKRANKFDAVVVIDEAYHYFYEKTFLNFIEKYPNVILLRTFSKLLSIPACRLGVIISSPEIISYIKKAKLTFDVNSIALLFGKRILENPKLIEDLIVSEKEGKEFVIKELTNHGYSYRDCKGNYILIKTRHDSQEITLRLKDEKRILIHSYKNPLLSRYIRVSVGSKKAMKKFMDAFLELDQMQNF